MSLFRCGGGEQLKIRFEEITQSAAKTPTSLIDFVGKTASNELLIYPSLTDKVYIIDAAEGGGVDFTSIIDLENRTFKTRFGGTNTVSACTVDVPFDDNVIRYGNLIQIFSGGTIPDYGTLKFDYTRKVVVAIY